MVRGSADRIGGGVMIEQNNKGRRTAKNAGPRHTTFQDVGN